jgi:beta-N-acetylhexosaminidase
MANPSALRRLCGQLVVGGFEGTAPPETFVQALVAGERGGAVLFARNLTPDPMQCAELTRLLAANSSLELPPLIAIDQEGGRVQRLKEPVLQLPPMRAFGRARDTRLVGDAAEALGRQLAALGITMNFAPVLDLDTCAENPIIGDRSFGRDGTLVEELGRAVAEGLRAAGVLSCAKHFPGHGDTTKDSHLDLPVVALEWDDVVRTHAGPFLRPPIVHDAIMTAHVVYPALDRDFPATLSRAVLELARPRIEGGIGFGTRAGSASFEGCIVSDDLEMKAIADRWPIEESAVLAIEAGCDALLICRSEALQARAVDGLSRRAAEDRAFEARVHDANARFLAMRRRAPPRPVKTRAAFDVAGAKARAVEARIAAVATR